MIATAQEAGRFLDALLAGLYRRAGERGADAWPGLTLIDDPRVAREVLGRPDTFIKNYAFLEALARGRFSANRSHWREHAALTRSWYRSAHQAIAPSDIKAIYLSHLADGPDLGADTLFERFVAAAVEVFSRVIGLSAPLPWDVTVLRQVREWMKMRQWVDWNGCDPPALHALDTELSRLRGRLRDGWRASQAGRAALAMLEAPGAAWRVSMPRRNCCRTCWRPARPPPAACSGRWKCSASKRHSRPCWRTTKAVASVSCSKCCACSRPCPS
ncbi:cytochrome P450 [Aquabacterium sp. A7-Y]|uniref:hypothetical protein n=1 Tax=Aquabacterium sp. A7-Y TaxID=1349605 RepID=UPI00223CCF3C|nr:hypothetical protein [Aquabacterium sp. A7-Y]MCW7538644.1 cytochrome P450 [Aquabacterium sp. A7-Y]